MKHTFWNPNYCILLIDELLGFSLGVDGSSMSRSSGVGVILPSREEGGLVCSSSSPLNNVSNNSTTSNYNNALSTIHATITNCQP